MKIKRVLALWSLAVLSAVQAGAASPDADAPEVYRWLRWTDPASGESLQGLYLVEVSQDSMVSRVLAETRGGTALVLTNTVDPARGITRTDLMDAEGRWRARVEVDLGITGSTLSEYFRLSERLAEGDSVSMRLSIAPDVSFTAQIAVDYPSVMQTELVRALAARGLIDRVASEIPEEVKAGILFLDASLSPSPLPSGEGETGIAHSLRGPLEILAGVLRRAEPSRWEAPGEAWPMEVGPPKRGLAIDDQAARELLERFPTLNPADPIEGGRVEEVAAIVVGSGRV